MVRISQITHAYSIHADMTKAEILLERNKKENSKFLEAFHDCTGKSIKSIIKDTERDFYMSPETAKKYGIIDSIVGGTNEKKIRE
jgi:ATP-dependent protease ClpP protease subunit